MSLKYAQKRKVFLFIFFATIKACNILFIAYMLKLMLNVASSGKKDMMQLVGLAGITAVGQIFFMCSNFLYEANKMEIIRQVNLYLKRKNIAYLVDQGESNIKQDLSLMTNDLKQIETNRVTAQLDMIFQSITFVGALSFAFYNSWEMTLIFIVASLAPAIVQIFTSKIITQKAKVWTKTNADYTQSISD
ncbi:MAG: ABC transporter ATP-binding protein, partial [Lactobacillus crispatus]|nr:ABC transporter ATP-binding protein [Lactobacillus crispatus]